LIALISKEIYYIFTISFIVVQAIIYQQKTSQVQTKN